MPLYSVLPRFSEGQGAIWKGHFSAVNGPSKGHFSAVNGWKRALLTKSALEWLNKRCTAQSTLCVGNKKGKTELKAMCYWYLKKKGRASFRLFQKGMASRKGRPAKEASVEHCIVWGYTSAQQLTTLGQSWWTTKEMVTNVGKNNLGKLCIHSVSPHFLLQFKFTVKRIFGIHKISDNNF